MTIDELAYQLRKAKIEMEHEVLLKEMEIILVSEAGFPITILGLVASLGFNLSLSEILMVSGFTAIVTGLIDWYREKKKEAIKAKQLELDNLLKELKA